MPRKSKNKSKSRPRPKRDRTLEVGCPKCGRRQPFTHDDAEYYCPTCGMSFDNDPDEGGDYFNDPTKRLDKRGN